MAHIRGSISFPFLRPRQKEAGHNRHRSFWNLPSSIRTTFAKICGTPAIVMDYLSENLVFKKDTDRSTGFASRLSLILCIYRLNWLEVVRRLQRLPPRKLPRVRYSIWFGSVDFFPVLFLKNETRVRQYKKIKQSLTQRFSTEKKTRPSS